MRIRNIEKFKAVIKAVTDPICGQVSDEPIIFIKGDQFQVEYWFTGLEKGFRSGMFDEGVKWKPYHFISHRKDDVRLFREWLASELQILNLEDEFWNGPLRIEKEEIKRFLKLLA
jgi:hypothetical protein